jgi:hypothetical protein
VSSCIQAINADCAYVLVPQSSAACSWLNPVVEVDAGEDAGDASDDGGDASDANDDGG